MAARIFGRIVLALMLVVGLCPASALAASASDGGSVATSPATANTAEGTAGRAAGTAAGLTKTADGAAGSTDATADGAEVTTEGSPSSTDGEVLVVYDNTANALPISRIMLAVSGANDQETVAELNDGAQTVVKVQVDEAKVDDLIDNLNASPDVAWAQRNFEYELTDVTYGDEVGAASGAGAESLDVMGGADTESLDATGEADAESIADSDIAGGADAESLDATDDPMLSRQYYVGDWDETHGASVEDAWTIAQTGQTVTVAVLDTGVLTTHEDLAANLDTEHMIDLVSTNPTPGVVSDAVGHGTHVAGIVAAQANNALGVAGTSYNAKVLPIQLFYKSGASYKTNTSYMLKAYEYLDNLVESGQLSDLHVINMSFGSYDAMDSSDYVFEAAIKEMREKHNVLSVASGGNGSQNKAKTSFIMPGDFDECLCVTALEKDGTDAVFSDYNEYKDISAPGVGILSTGYGSASSYVNMSGTSMAAPEVSGIAALLWALEPDLTVDQAVTAIKETANPVVQGAYYHGSATGSAGCIDAAAALQYVKDNYYTPDSRDELASLLVECDALKESAYTADSWANFETARADAQSVYEDAAATSDQVDSAYRGLLQAKNALVTWSYQFSDVSYAADNWQVPGINYVARFDVMTGYTGTDRFGPDDVITRGQVATVLYRAAGAESAGAGDAGRAAQTFADVSAGAYYAAAIDWCQQQGIVSGYADSQDVSTGYFGPDDQVTREQLAKMISLFAQVMGADISNAPTDILHSLSGWETASSWSLPFFAWCTHNEVITGYVIGDASYLYPQNTATRAQMAKMMMVTLGDVLQLHQ